MSKVISFSISDRYLDKLRGLYPDLTDNLAAKQFLTDRLDDNLDDKLDDGIKTLIESSLSSSLDDALDAKLDDKLKSLIETSLDGILDERLDATVGKFLSEVTERMARLESRLDDNLDGRLDDMEYLLKRERECSIATSPIPTSSSPAIEDEDDDDVTGDSDSLFKLALKLDHLDDQALIDAIESELEESTEIDESDYEMVTSPLPTVVTVETADTVESVDDTVETAYKDEPGKVAIEKTQSEIARLLGVHSSTVTRWKQNKAIPSEYSDKCRFNGDKTKILWIS